MLGAIISGKLADFIGRRGVRSFDFNLQSINYQEINILNVVTNI